MSLCDDDGARALPSDPDEDEDAVIPNAIRLEDDSGIGGGGIVMLDIIRFWNSACFFCK
jgi:hypothetical protein